jgi:hypothetical protein
MVGTDDTWSLETFLSSCWPISLFNQSSYWGRRYFDHQGTNLSSKSQFVTYHSLQEGYLESGSLFSVPQFPNVQCLELS